jgi:preprotein translocase subunit SecD
MKKLTALLLIVVLFVTACSETGENEQESVLYALSPQFDGVIDESELEEFIRILRKRIDSAGLSRGQYNVQASEGRLMVSLDSALDEPDRLIEQITQVGELTFQHDGEIVLTGEHVKRADSKYNAYNSNFEVSLEFTEEGGELFYEITSELSGGYLSVLEIWIDDTLLSAPTVSHPISGGNAAITGGNGGFTFEEAKALAEKIDSGALPYRLGIEKIERTN